MRLALSLGSKLWRFGERHIVALGRQKVVVAVVILIRRVLEASPWGSLRLKGAVNYVFDAATSLGGPASPAGVLLKHCYGPLERIERRRGGL
ncbi:hypothetical protein [Hymenobacter volaticus]|uniref:Uncharacterized protein n=1 Tax=Hymenobacter volaticus TaxID=2932254 RepID=A0ABY4GF04_9BACT|nr:hypothetical protein [Hymenobacter volaticus]UOQ69401.1 hypothetical protein MUN86_27315 [Hymenobacter volaticus]